jgi:hypothetical protein
MPRKTKLNPSADDVTTPLPPTARDGDPISAIVAKFDRRERASGSAQWRVDALEPNVHNARLFPDSLAPESIALLAEDLKARGLEVPIRIMPDGTILDGERRWSAAKRLGWTMIDVVVGPQLTDVELLDRIIGACTSARQMTVREQVNIHQAVSEQYKRNEGRGPGRPQSKPSPDGEGFLSPQQISTIAAAKAGFGSVSIAERAVAVFSRGSDELREKVTRHELSITAAYRQVPKRPRCAKLPAAAQSAERTVDAGRALPVGQPESEANDADRRLLASGVDVVEESILPALPSGDRDPDLAPASPCQGRKDTARPEDESRVRSEVADAATSALPQLYEGELLDEPGRASLREACKHVRSSDSAVALDEHATMTVDQNLEQVYEHLSSLAEEDGRAAKSFVGRVVRRMKEILDLHA